MFIWFLKIYSPQCFMTYMPLMNLELEEERSDAYLVWKQWTDSSQYLIKFSLYGSEYQSNLVHRQNSITIKVWQDRKSTFPFDLFHQPSGDIFYWSLIIPLWSYYSGIIRTPSMLWGNQPGMSVVCCNPNIGVVKKDNRLNRPGSNPGHK